MHTYFKVKFGKSVNITLDGKFKDVDHITTKTVPNKELEIMQYTWLKDNSTWNKEVYEYDILDKEWFLIGNLFENEQLLKDNTNFLIQGFGTQDWEATNKEAMDRWCRYS